MKTGRILAISVMTLGTLGVLVPRAQATEESNGSVIIEWNQFLQQNVTGPPIGQLRDYPMLHIAIA
jgi:hypothetical protein